MPERCPRPARLVWQNLTLAARGPSTILPGMDVGMLIDAIVRQTTVLIAQLATSGGERTPLSHTANQVFLDLSRELREQGLGSKVVADMFGMALRTYQTKVQRLAESQTERGHTLWEAIYEHIREHATERPIARADVMKRFRHDDPIAVRSVLRDQVDSGLVLRTGRADATRYQFVVGDAQPEQASNQRTDHVVAMMVHRKAPASVAQLAELLSLSEEQVSASLERLQREGRVRLQESESATRYTSDGCVLPLGSEQGWEAAVFDHYQALVSSLCNKLRQGARTAVAHDRIGGSTYSYQVWPAHPYFEEATGFLANFRARGSALRKKIAAYNADHLPPESDVVRVLVYGGQNILESSEDKHAQLEDADE